ncbi:MAG: hypothetical protein OXN17_17080 [Candidatus Poribacteria bacterium]|nr:hypothetical protein [Candidatus Poribacteria bacterium]MDE0503608.1 hypothetical protein [Candidatus Poribacteria bacterium]
MKKRGRTTKLNAECAAILCDAFNAGGTLESCAASAGITLRTLLNWIAKAKDAPPGSLLDNVLRAYNDSKPALLRKIDQDDYTLREEFDADGNLVKSVRTTKSTWRRAAWLLKCRFPDEFGDRVALDLDSIDAELDLEPLSPAMREAMKNKE